MTLIHSKNLLALVLLITLAGINCTGTSLPLLYRVEKWLGSTTCTDSADLEMGGTVNTCMDFSYHSADIGDYLPTSKIIGCAGGYAFFQNYNDQECQRISTYIGSSSYASGACYPDANKKGSSRITCLTESAAPTAGASVTVLSQFSQCGESQSVVSANLNTCLAFPSLGGTHQTFYEVSGCASGGNATFNYYSDSNCSTPLSSSLSQSIPTTTGCNPVAPFSLSSLRLNVTCYAANSGPGETSTGGTTGGGASSTGGTTTSSTGTSSGADSLIGPAWFSTFCLTLLLTQLILINRTN